jgi:hypothetical protein
MTPKFLTLTRFAAPNDTILVNPRRVNSFVENRHPSTQPDLKGKLGVVVSYNQNDYEVVRESLDEIKQLLK